MRKRNIEPPPVPEFNPKATCSPQRVIDPAISHKQHEFYKLDYKLALMREDTPSGLVLPTYSEWIGFNALDKDGELPSSKNS